MRSRYNGSNWNSADGETGMKKLLLGWRTAVLTLCDPTQFVSDWLKLTCVVESSTVGCFVVTAT